MEELKDLIKQNKITYKDVTTYVFISKYPLKTARDLSILTGMNYSRLTESIHVLLKYKLIVRVEERPNKFIKNEE